LFKVSNAAPATYVVAGSGHSTCRRAEDSFKVLLKFLSGEGESLCRPSFLETNMLNHVDPELSDLET
jgi:hypothetical protein